MSTLDAACARARAWLDRHQNADGTWGYRPGQPGAGEPTLLAAAAGLRGWGLALASCSAARGRAAP